MDKQHSQPLQETENIAKTPPEKEDKTAEQVGEKVQAPKPATAEEKGTEETIGVP
jgi:hypothetical protein